MAASVAGSAPGLLLQPFKQLKDWSGAIPIGKDLPWVEEVLRPIPVGSLTTALVSQVSKPISMYGYKTFNSP